MTLRYAVWGALSTGLARGLNCASLSPLAGGLQTCGHQHPAQDEADDWAVVKVALPDAQSAQDRHPRQDPSPRTRRRLCLPNRMEIHLPGWTSTTILKANLYWTLTPLGSGFGACVA